MDSDTISLLGTAGTWMAVVLALIALLGIVTPWLLLKEIHSDRTLALNFIHDHDKPPFVSRGWGFGRMTRLFRTIRVYDFMAYKDWSEGKDLVVAQPSEEWELKEVKRTACRIGWARFCRLVEAYEVAEKSVPLRTRGELVIEDGETWLPVSACWVLAVGLLGRYGLRKDLGVDATFSATLLRPELPGQRHLRTATRWEKPAADHEMVSQVSTQIWGTTGSSKFDRQRLSQGTKDGGSKYRLCFISNHERQRDLSTGDSTPLPPSATRFELLFWLSNGFFWLEAMLPRLSAFKIRQHHQVFHVNLRTVVIKRLKF